MKRNQVIGMGLFIWFALAAFTRAEPNTWESYLFQVFALAGLALAAMGRER